MNSNPNTAYFISCVGKKRQEPTFARDLYISDWFIKARNYVVSKNKSWFILSAAYGLVTPDQMLEPYEKTLNNMPIEERKLWANGVNEQIKTTLPYLTSAVFLAGQRYREFLAQHLIDRQIDVHVPMEGLGIGQQLSWLKKHTPASD